MMMARADAPLPCPDCGAQSPDPADSCALRFDALLALDHSRQEPWGSRHGLAFAAFALQHPSRFRGATRDRAYAMLVAAYRRGEPLSHVMREARRAQAGGGVATATPVPSSPAMSASAPPHPERPSFAITIHDLGAFDEATYAVLLDAWCRATLNALSPGDGSGS